MADRAVALVSVDDFVAVARVHADRVHDLVRRMGCSREEAVEVVETSVLDLLDALVQEAESVVDMAGWWFGHAFRLAARVLRRPASPTENGGEEARSVLAGTEGEARVRAALAELPEPHRLALLLRDAYDLAPTSVAVALRDDLETTTMRVSTGRLRLFSAYGGGAVSATYPHGGRLRTDPATLGRLVDGSLPPHEAVALRRHVHGCNTCEDICDAQSKARRLLSALPVVALPDDERDPLLDRVAARAQATLPTLEEVLLVAETDVDEPPLVSPLIAVAVIVFALVLGVLVAVATRSG